MSRLPADVIALQGGTGHALMRRLHDARFATRFFVGAGIDVGAGYDSLSCYEAFFPLITSVLSWDAPEGDGAELKGIDPDGYDFLYSSHCLEHMPDPASALRRWLEVVRPGGHVIVVVPDERLYEQGVWPSHWNPDHRHSFTLGCPSQEWAKDSVNVLDLLRWVGATKAFTVVKLEQLDHAYFREIGMLDQTRAAYGEAGIEFVLRKERGPRER